MTMSPRTGARLPVAGLPAARSQRKFGVGMLRNVTAGGPSRVYLDLRSVAGLHFSPFGASARVGVIYGAFSFNSGERFGCEQLRLQ